MKRFIPIVWLAFSFQACTSPEPDTTDPAIEVLSMTPNAVPGLVCGETQDHVCTLSSTDTLKVTFRLTDDVELSQYKLDLHNNFDCHGHGKVETTDWYVISIEDVAGSDQTITRELPVPTNVTSGNYHFHIHVADASGNNGESAIIYSLNVTNVSDTDAPVLSATTPSSSNFSAQKGTTINFEGSLSDNNPLGPGTNGRLELRYWKSGGQNIYTLYEEDFENAVGETYNFSFDATVPATIADGTYIFELLAFDAVNNPSNTVQFTVEIF